MKKQQLKGKKKVFLAKTSKGSLQKKIKSVDFFHTGVEGVRAKSTLL